MVAGILTISLIALARVGDWRRPDSVPFEMRQHYLPGVMEIPAAVGEIVRLQNQGYRLVLNH
jgi:hypothetical protein